MDSKVKGKEESKGEKKIDDSSSSSLSSSRPDHKLTNLDKDNNKETMEVT